MFEGNAAYEATVWGQLLILGTLIIREITAALRERRNRRWELEDRAYRDQLLKSHLIESKVLNKAAIKEANELNQKILAIGEVRMRGSSQERKET